MAKHSAMPIAMNQHMQSSKLKVLGAMSTKWLAAMPDVPTRSGSGYAGFEALSFFGLLARRAGPSPSPASAVS